MDELGELLELLYSARGRFRTARGVLLHRWSQRLTIEAMKREEETRTRRGGSQSQIMFATRAGDEPEPPDLHEERTRFWWEPPDRLREEVESDAKHARTTVVDGELWWMYMPEWGAISNVELSDEERAHHVVGRGESFRPALDPSGLIGVLDIDGVEVEGDRLCVRARPRDDLDGPSAHFRLRLAVGADAYELLVDRERGTVLRLAAYLDGEEIAVTEVEEVVFDEDFPEATFVFVPPPGEEVRPPEMVSHREYSLEEAAEAASFRVFAVPELPEGHWRLDVRFHDRRERPPIPALVTLVYHRSDGQGALVISQRAAGEGAESWPAIDPQLEDVERDGVGYTILRGDREHGGSGVAFERDGTAIRLQSSELDVEVLLELAASLEPAG